MRGRWQPQLVAATVGLLVAAFLATPAMAYSVARGRIEGDQGFALQLRGVNWFGFETETHVVHGLWLRNWHDVIAQIKAMGFNAVRLPVCPDTLHGSPVNSPDYKLNPDLEGLDSLQALDRVVRGLDAAGLYILLDHHRSDCHAISELWYTKGYTEDQWVADLSFLAGRYRDVAHVIGMDLKNEPHGQATLAAGAPATDWNVAAERAARAVLGIAPRWLIFVEGVEGNPKCSAKDPHFWGENLEPLNCSPLRIPRERLVLAPHTYGPDVFKQPFFSAPDFPRNMPAIWDRNFGQFLSQGFAVILGEFGGKYGEGDPRDRVWQDMLVGYLSARHVNSAFYWALNPDSGDTGGLLRDDWKTPRLDKLMLLRRLWTGGDSLAMARLPPLPAAPPGTPVPAAAASEAELAGATAAELTAARRTLSDWGGGYCQEAEVHNLAGHAVRWRAQLAFDGSIDQLWNATQGSDGSFSGASWNAVLPAGQRTTFGFCAVRVRRALSAGFAAQATTPAIQVTTAVDADWGQGYCARVQLRNGSATAQDWRVRIQLGGALRQLWKARIATVDGHLTASGEDYNRQLAPGESTDFGLCVQR